jgi:hypothetical protein
LPPEFCVIVNVVVTVPALPSLTDTSLMEIEGKGAASDTDGAEIRPGTAAASAIASGLRRWVVRGREGFISCVLLSFEGPDPEPSPAHRCER